MSERPSLGDAFANWRSSELPLARKIAAVLRNNTIKWRTRQSCCGNHGEPGC